MRIQCLKAIWATLFIFSSTLIYADDSSETQASPFSATIGIYSDYMFRGITQTDDGIAIQGSLDYTNENGFYAGIWGSNVEFNGANNTSLEVDIYLGYVMTIMDTQLDFAALRYMYPDGNDFEDFNEYKLAATFSDFTVSFSYSNDMYGTGEDAWYLNGAYSFALPMDLSLNLSLGYSDYDRAILNNGSAADQYTDWSIGLSKSISGFDLNLQYIDSDSNSEEMFGKDATDGRLVFSVSRTF